MARSKFLVSLLVAVAFCAMAGTSFAKTDPKPKCAFTGDYSFFFWSPGYPDAELAGVGFFAVNCAGAVLPGGIINCNVDGDEYETFIESGAVFLEADGEGTMLIETESSDGICGTGDNALELDVSVTQGGNRILFTSNGEPLAASGTTPNAGHRYVFAGRAGKCFTGQISGCYDIHFWEPTKPLAGDCTICVNGAGAITSGSCSCNEDLIEYLSEIESGPTSGYVLGEDCQSSTGFMAFVTSSDLVCGETGTIYLDFAVADGGQEIFGACDDFNDFDCAFEGWKQ